MEPEEVEQKEFLVALRGYDREQIDAFVREVAQELRRLRAQAASSVPVSAQTSDVYKSIGEKTSKILLAAEEAGEEIKATAAAEAAQILGDARIEAAEAAKQQLTEKRRAEEELRRLREARSLLKTQLQDVQRRLEEMISRLDTPLELPETKPAPSASAAAAPPKTSERPPPSQARPAAPPATPRAARRPFVPAAGAPPGRTEPAGTRPARAEPAAATSPTAEAGTISELKVLLEEVRSEREAARHEIEQVLAETGVSSPTPASSRVPASDSREATAPAAEAASAPTALAPEVERRNALLNDAPSNTASRLKRALQEDQNILLDNLRTIRKGTSDPTFFPLDDQLPRFFESLRLPLGAAYSSGWEVGGGSGSSSGPPGPAVDDLIRKQVVNPLRKEVSRIVDAGMEAQDTRSSISDRAGDIYRVWKGVRAELLGEGLAYAAFHQGLLDAWRERGAGQKVWVVSDDEIDCPKGVCASNAAAGTVSIEGTFPSGHSAPPAHGGCSCTLGAPTG